MKTNDEIRKYLTDDLGYDEDFEFTLFEDPDYAPAFIGITSDDRAVYDRNLMVKALMESDNMSEEDALEFLEYNTLRALPYIPNAPVIMTPV